MNITIKSALLSVYHKDGLAPLAQRLHALGTRLYSTGGTQTYLESLGLPVIPVESLTGYPSILDGRVKTLHPAIFGGLLAKREALHLAQLAEYNIPAIDCVIVDLYPFEETVANTTDEAEIIEKIDIGGVSLLRAAAKNYNHVAVVPSRADYSWFLEKLETGEISAADRLYLARRAFQVTAHYDSAISRYFNRNTDQAAFSTYAQPATVLRYGENPHQQAIFYGDINAQFEQLSGKAISYNNMVDIEAAIQLMREFENEAPTFAILKHTNACGLAQRINLQQAWEAALAGDPVSAFGGIFISNTEVDEETARLINRVFYEVLIAPDFSEGALDILRKKDQRILLKLNTFKGQPRNFRSILSGIIEQDADLKTETAEDFRTVTEREPTESEIQALLFAVKAVKHLKSNAIALVKDNQLIGMGCGQPSRVDALRQAIAKAQSFNFDLQDAVMASDAFFPFNDCVQIAAEAGIKAVVQPGGSVRDQDSIDVCNALELAMVFTGIRHFRH